MRRWRTTGGFQRVIDWVLWTAVTFQKKLPEPAPDSIWQVTSFTPYLSRLTLGKHVTSQGMTRVTSDDEISPREQASNNSLTPTPPRPWHICNVPLAMIFQVLYCLCVGGLQASYAHQTSATNAPNLNLQVLNILMDLFNSDIRQTPQNIVAREWLSDTCPECQLLVLDFVSRLAVDFPAVKPQLLACNLWPTLSSHYFFAPLLWHVTDAAARGLNIEHPLVKNVTGTYLFLEHRRYLFQLIEFLATLGDSCHFECATLLVSRIFPYLVMCSRAITDTLATMLRAAVQELFRCPDRACDSDAGPRQQRPPRDFAQVIFAAVLQHDAGARVT
jgi:hypothetical protein